MGVGADWDTECSCQAEVGNLDNSLAVDEEVVGLEISVQDPVRMAVFDRQEDLVRVALKYTAFSLKF